MKPRRWNDPVQHDERYTLAEAHGCLGTLRAKSGDIYHAWEQPDGSVTLTNRDRCKRFTTVQATRDWLEQH